MTFLIGARALQGVGAGGLTALVQVVIASIVSPRERGRYSGYIGAVFAVATVSGPLLGGLIVDTPWLGWRWCFYVGLPVAVVAFAVLQKTLHLSTVKRDVSIDYLGAGLIAGGVSVLLIWVSLGGRTSSGRSSTTAWMVTLGVLLLVAAVLTELRSRNRSSRCGCSATAPRAWPRSPRSWSAWRCSAPRCSCPSTSRSHAA